MTLSLLLISSGCTGGRIVKLQNVEGVIQTCEVSSYTALVTGSGSRDSVINKCISELEHAGYKVVSTKSNMWESNN